MTLQKDVLFMSLFDVVLLSYSVPQLYFILLFIKNQFRNRLQTFPNFRNSIQHVVVLMYILILIVFVLVLFVVYIC